MEQDCLHQEILNLKDYLTTLQTLVRVNNLLLSRFILQLSEVRKELHLPKRQVFFKFELLDDDYKLLVEEYGKDEVDKALYHLDRLLLNNKQQCPHNIKRYISNRLQKRKDNRDEKRKAE